METSRTTVLFFILLGLFCWAVISASLQPVIVFALTVVLFIAVAIQEGGLNGPTGGI